MFEEQQLAQVFMLLARIARAIVATVGPQCEVVVHDLRDPEQTVVAISGNLTGRRVGAPVPDPSMLPENLHMFKDDVLREQTRTPPGRELVSSSVWVRDSKGNIVGAICINMDFSDLRRARDLLDRALFANSVAQDGCEALTTPSLESFETFATSPEEFVAIALRGAINKIGKPIHHLHRQDKIQLIEELELVGVFRFPQAVDIVIQELGISRASLYAYLKEIRQRSAQ